MHVVGHILNLTTLASLPEPGHLLTLKDCTTFWVLKTTEKCEDILRFITYKNTFTFHIFCNNHCHEILERIKGRL